MQATAPSPIDLSGNMPVVEELPSTFDPWQAFRSIASLPHAVFLDSAMSHPHLGRYSYLTADPFEWMTARRGSMVLQSGGVLANDPLAWLRRQMVNFGDGAPVLAGLPTFQGGAIGMFGYDVCHYVERLPRPAIDDFETPDMAVGFYDWVAAYDHVEKRGWLISTGWPATKPRQRQQRAAQRLRQARQWLNSGILPTPFNLGTSPQSLAACYPLPIHKGIVSNFDRETYLAKIARAIDYVHAGDCFQVNIAQRLMTQAIGTPLDLYEKLRTRNPAPFAAYFDLGDFVIASASPERFLRVDEGEVETRPIKGTRPRGVSAAEDEGRQRELLASAKDRAENVMIVDLLRNDLGRVCEYGSINVPALCKLETYQYVHHLVSQVCGKLRRDKTPVDLLRAAFPGGSVTGAPKIRAMEIIAELEPTARGPYCGSLGYIGFNGNMDSNILIRTFTIGRGWAQFPVGGGIVADSVPEREYEETLHKAEGMLRALN
ncbi:MAG TPA: aminodeoxychorismate synthase component I [Gemmataceae bacterium]|nr:aminodeoxychorismate synthase component I [Gemmataceae bacterium]